MEKKIYDAYLKIIEAELLKSLGCTEPAAVAFTAAKATSLLGKMPESMEVNSSGNIIKNVKGVIVPNSGGLRGIAPAAILGMLVNKPEMELAILDGATPEDTEKAKELLQTDFCKSTLEEGEGNLFVDVTVRAGDESARAVIRKNHTNIELLEKNGEVLQQGKADEEGADIGELKKLLNVADIVKFAKEVDVEDVKPFIGPAIECNMAIGEEGLKGGYGAEVGKTLIETYGDEDVLVRLKAKAAAGSDARMAGSVLPVVINSGSGNQGITITCGVKEFANGIGASEEETYRALTIANLISVHIKRHIGPLSAFCGAVSAGAGVSAGITYLQGGTTEQIGMAITNVLCDLGGAVCDGAKASCAAKIASSLDAAVMGSKMALAGRVYQPDEGLVLDNVDETIKSVGYVGRVGMRETDIEILHVMLGDRDLSI